MQNGSNLSAHSAESEAVLVRQIDFTPWARFNRAMTGEHLRHKTRSERKLKVRNKNMKKILALLLAITMIAAFCACTQKPAEPTTGSNTTDTPATSGSDLIKVGIINNDPNESGYRTANDKDMKAMFTKEKMEATYRLSSASMVRSKRMTWMPAACASCRTESQPEVPAAEISR